MRFQKQKRTQNFMETHDEVPAHYSVERTKMLRKDQDLHELPANSDT
jgi:hypothetical protein